MKVLNASGLDAGHQDFSIVSRLREKRLRIEWTVIESPRSKFLDNEVLRAKAQSFGIDIIRWDHASEAAPHLASGFFDVVLFTEIIEHLDHSVTLTALSRIRSWLRSDGVLIVSTPNLLSVLNRLRFLLGFGDDAFFNDGPEAQKLGIFGHVTLWDRRRLCRLLTECDYRVTSCRTRNYGVGPGRLMWLRRLAYRGLQLASAGIPHAGQILVATAKRADLATRSEVDVEC